MGVIRRIFGILMLIAAPIVIAVGYANVPSADTCNYINSQNQQLGEPATCSSTPAAGYFVVAGILAVAGLLFLAPWLLRWIAGK
jgi:hypothetical protein